MEHHGEHPLHGRQIQSQIQVSVGFRVLGFVFERLHTVLGLTISLNLQSQQATHMFS